MKYAILFFVGFTALIGWSCVGNSTSTNNNIILNINGNNSGCTIISYLDGSEPVTETSNGSFTIYTNLSNGSHTISVDAFNIGQSQTCTFNINNTSHSISVYNPCAGSGGAFSASCD